MNWLLLAPCMFLGAITFRTRGGWTEGWRFQLPGQVARLTWAFACALTALAAGMVWWQATALIPLAWAATTLPLLGAIDMGHNQGSFIRDFTFGTLHGLSIGACVTAVLATAHFVEGGLPLWWLPLFGGAAWSVCYALAWLRTDWSILTRLHLGKYGNPPEFAELLFGFQFAAVLFIAAV